MVYQKVAGAIKVGAKRYILSFIPKSTLAGVIVNITCVGIENVKILLRVANGEITMVEAFDRMGQNTIAMTYGLA